MDHHKSRKFVLNHLVLLLGATLINLGIRFITHGPSSAVENLLIFVLALVLCFCVYRKSTIAKLLLILAYGLMGLLGLVNIFSSNPIAIILSVVSGIYAWCAFIFARSAQVKSYFFSVDRPAA